MAGGWRLEERTGTATALHQGWPGVLAHPGRRAVAVCHATETAVVLGSTQPESVVDAARAAADGISVARRRSGGGAVLVTPSDPVWIDVWVPTGDPLSRDDVARAFDWLGDVWADALGRSGITGVSAHRHGSLPCTRWAATVCFGGVGTGEVVTADGRKVVGLAQRRNRQGAWFHGACYLHFDAARLVGVLAMSEPEREAATVGLGSAAAGVSDLSERAGRGPIRGEDVVASLAASLP